MTLITQLCSNNGMSIVAIDTTNGDIAGAFVLKDCGMAIDYPLAWANNIFSMALKKLIESAWMSTHPFV